MKTPECRNEGGCFEVNYAINLLSDQKELDKWIKTDEDHTYLLQSLTPSAWRSVVAIFIDWTIIFGAVSTVYYISLWLFPLALLFIGARQRAFSNIRHDAAHWNLFNTRSLNDIVADLFGSLAMFETVNYYRADHIYHHTYLGLNSHDPDTICHANYGIDDENPEQKSSLRKFIHIFFNINAFSDSIGKSFFRINTYERLKVIIWWLVFSEILVQTVSLRFLWVFIGMWILSRITTYHAIRLFAEFLDHSGLKSGTNIGNTRTLPKRSIFTFFVNPHQDVYHLTHHLYPKIPHYFLEKLHKILLKNLFYKQAHHCDGYFFGAHPARLCWIGCCEENIL